MPRIAPDKLVGLAARALKKAGASSRMARMTAQALVAADMEGLSGHGVSRVALYAQHLREGRANGAAKPVVVRSSRAGCLVDANGGLAFPAAALAAREAAKRAKRYGVAFAGVTNSHHFGAAAYHLMPVAQAGLVGLAFSNSPAAINAWGARKAFFGTNPICAVFPRRNAESLVVDLALTEVVRGKIMVYAKEGKPLPPGWAVDRDGNPTTDAKAALTGSLAAIGGMKGTMLAMMVELLCVALTGAALSFENESYFEPGNKPRIGHAIVAIDPGALAGADTYYERLETLVSALLAQEGVRLPGARRQQAAAAARAEGVEVPDALYQGAARACAVRVVQSPVLAIHGGAGTMSRSRMTASRERDYSAALTAALRAGYAVLADGGTSLDAVVAAVIVLEDTPLFNAGRGAVFNSVGEHELDAAVMEGATRRAGAVAGVRRVKNPVLAARAVMERTPHVLLAGAGADRFARAAGLQMVPAKYYSTPARAIALERARADAAATAADRHGTVGAVALDGAGNLAAATSTGGFTNKMAGRVGDSPLVGAGTYADNAACAVSATGSGEHYIRAVLAHDVAARMRYLGESLPVAAQRSLAGVAKLGGDGGLIAVDRAGRVAMPFNSEGMYRGCAKNSQFRVAIYAKDG